MSRREFLAAGGVAAGAGLLGAACGAVLATPAPTATHASLPTHGPTLEVLPTHGPTAASAPARAGWSGRIMDRSGAPLANARVTLGSADGGFFRETRSDDDGRYSFADAPSGSLNMGAASLDYEYQEAAGATGGMDFNLGPDVHPGRWSVIGDTEPEAFGGTNSGVLMPDGRIIYCHDTRSPVVFDPATGDKALPNPSPSVQGCHMVTYLPDGRILYVGGGEVDAGGNFNGVSVATVKAFDPAGLTWEVFPSLNEKRWYPGLARLADGRFLVFGGGGQPERIRLETCEIFDPASRQWTRTGSLTAPGGFGPCVLLLTGEVLVTWFPPQRYNLQTGQWRTTGMFLQPLRNERMPSLPIPSDHPDFTAILLDDGRVAAIGMRRSAGATMVEIYDPTTEQWTLGTSPEVVRSMPEVLRLPTGKILVAAGKNESQAHGDFTNEFGYTSLVDLYDPASGRWRRMGGMKIAREYHAITLLAPDGRVVVTGGPAQPGLQPPHTASKEIEAFEPPYLFRGPRPRVASLSSRQLAAGGSLTLEVTGTSGLTGLVLLGMNAITHWMDGGVPRRLSLPFTQVGSTVTASLPADPVQAMPGFYLLFALVDDIPSEGLIVQVA